MSFTGKNANANSQVVERAGQDPAFRAKLLADPKAAIKEAFGVVIPDGMSIQVRENTHTEVFIVLDPEQMPDGELSEAELASVAGGESNSDICNGFCVTSW
ncbi:MAG: NHLP leader peptide family RiPP precursor [Holophaga sp.]|nr:NHLP leader peptide family RiPP precursor [Holophaga sp.]